MGRGRSYGSVSFGVGKKTGGYIKEIKALGDEKGLSVREEPSLVSQLKCIEKGLLTKMER